MLMFVGEPGSVESASERLINAGVLGAVLVLAIIALAWTVKKWSDTQEKRVADQQTMTQNMTNLVNQFRDAVRDMTTATASLKEAISSQGANSDDMAQKIQKVEATLDSVVRDAVRFGSYRRQTPPGGGVPRP